MCSTVYHPHVAIGNFPSATFRNPDQCVGVVKLGGRFVIIRKAWLDTGQLCGSKLPM